MGIFSRILDKLRGQVSPTASQNTGELAGSAQQGQPATQPAASQQPLQNVDIDAVLSQLASKKGGGGNYKQSIVDLLKLLDLDSSMNARKELAEELGVTAGAHGSAEQNIALHKAVIKKLEENGGKVPESMKN
jgi:Domain of unknown function (DUF3597)